MRSSDGGVLSAVGRQATQQRPGETPVECTMGTPPYPIRFVRPSLMHIAGISAVELYEVLSIRRYLDHATIAFQEIRGAAQIHLTINLARKCSQSMEYMIDNKVEWGFEFYPDGFTT